MITVSMICCFTNNEQLKDLMLSLKGVKNYTIEWINIDNSNNVFDSCAKALNYGFASCSGEVIIFLHQDIVFSNTSELDIIINAALKGNLVGVAGRKGTGGPVFSCIYDGLDHIQRYQTFKEDQIEVATCDECLIAMRRSTFEALHGFDEVTFDGWHFYGVDISLRANIKGIPCVVVPVYLWHKSKGKMDKKWYLYEKRLAKKYRDDFRVIYYPCGRCYTSPKRYIAASMIRPIYKKIQRVKQYKKVKG